MRILQRQVVSDLARVFGLAVCVLTALLMVTGVAGEAAKNGLGARQILAIIPWVAPSLLPYTIPATLLLAVCIVYGRMAGDHEITAMKAAGINVWTILVPSFVLGIVLSLGTFILTDQFIPLGRARIERIVTLAMEDIFLDVLRNDGSYHDPEHGISIVVSRVTGRTLVDPMFRYQVSPGEVATVSARVATVRFDAQKQQVLLTLLDGYFETPRGDNAAFEREQLPFPTPVPTDTLKSPRNMTIKKISSELADMVRERKEPAPRQLIRTVSYSEAAAIDLVPRQAPRDTLTERLCAKRSRKLQTEIHSRAALSCSCLFFVLIGSPYAIVQAKRQFLTNFALCFAPILVGYYPVVLLTTNLCRDGILDPAWGMWLGNLGLFMMACFVLRRMLRN